MNKQISWSQLETYNSCPYKWWCQYTKKLYSAGNIFSAYGSAMHDLLEEMYIKKNFNKNVYIEKWKSIFKNEYTKKQYPKFDEKLIDWKLRSGYPMIHNFFKTAEKYNLLRPSLATEQKVISRFRGYDVVCILDSINVIDNKLTLIDYKTGAEKDSHKLQITLYAEAINKQHSKLTIEQGAVWYLKESKIITFELQRKETLNYMMNTLNEMEKSFKTGVFEQRKHQYCDGCIAREKGLCKK